MAIHIGRLLRSSAGAILLAGSLSATPSYTAAGIVRAGEYTPGPFAPNSIVTLFGSDLSRSEHTLSADDIHGGRVPTEMNYTQVAIDNVADVPLLYVSPGQINFLIPSTALPGPAKLVVIRQGLRGPEVTITIAAAAPALFVGNAPFAIATHADNSLVTPDAQAHAGEIVVLYATGLGSTLPNPEPDEIPRTAAPVAHLSDLKVLLGGMPVDAGLVKYAGLTPGSIGLYQVNVALPGRPPGDVEVRVAIGGQASAAGLLLSFH
jgi:uncharacterized protein (TIGR03437 family)